ncbi:MAG TPA: MFS transporter [Polyangiaceae bacterium]|nr:MFS transporter [Polyangiaceae bacterium]
MRPSASPALRRELAFALVVCSTVLGIAGTDLVLPAVPTLPSVLGGDLERAQLVLAAFVAGSAVGLLGFGALGSRFDQRSVLAASLLGYGAVSLAAGYSTSLDALIALRFVQGAAGSAAAVFAPGMLRALYGDMAAVAALGRLGSIEGLTPALAPIAGTWLLQAFGWNASFEVIGVGAAGLGVGVLLGRALLPALVARRAGGGYGTLLTDPRFMRYALSQAFTLGGLLVFVFGSPTVFVAALGGTLRDFIVMQVVGITSFIIAANLAGRLSRTFGPERLVWRGSVLSAAGAAALLLYALLGGRNTLVVSALFVPLNLGLGLRGPPGFHRAVVAARGDDARGAALVVVAILGSTAAGTAAVAPFITLGLLPISLAACVLSAAALVLLRWLPALEEPGEPASAIEPV